MGSDLSKPKKTVKTRPKAKPKPSGLFCGPLRQKRSLSIDSLEYEQNPDIYVKKSSLKKSTPPRDIYHRSSPAAHRHRSSPAVSRSRTPHYYDDAPPTSKRDHYTFPRYLNESPTRKTRRSVYYEDEEPIVETIYDRVQDYRPDNINYTTRSYNNYRTFDSPRVYREQKPNNYPIIEKNYIQERNIDKTRHFANVPQALPPPPPSTLPPPTYEYVIEKRTDAPKNTDVVIYDDPKVIRPPLTRVYPSEPGNTIQRIEIISTKKLPQQHENDIYYLPTVSNRDQAKEYTLSNKTEFTPSIVRQSGGVLAKPNYAAQYINQNNTTSNNEYIILKEKTFNKASTLPTNNKIVYEHQNRPNQFQTVGNTNQETSILTYTDALINAVSPNIMRQSRLQGLESVRLDNNNNNNNQQNPGQLNRSFGVEEVYAKILVKPIESGSKSSGTNHNTIIDSPPLYYKTKKRLVTDFINFPKTLASNNK